MKPAPCWYSMRSSAALAATEPLWAFEQFGIVPDILLLGKAWVVECHSALLWPTGNHEQPHPRSGTGAYQYLRRANTCCAAGLAAFNVLLDENWWRWLGRKNNYSGTVCSIRRSAVRSRGPMMAVEFDSFGMNKKIIDALISEGVFTDWFLFADNCLRIGRR